MNRSTHADWPGCCARTGRTGSAWIDGENVRGYSVAGDPTTGTDGVHDAWMRYARDLYPKQALEALELLSRRQRVTQSGHIGRLAEHS